MKLQPKIPAVMSWSGGKDSAYALHKILAAAVYDVQYLLSTFDASSGRLSGHGVSEELIECQAKHIGIPLLKLYMQENSNAEYERRMEESLSTLKAKGIGHIIFGDIYLEDLRQYRETKMASFDMQGVFPIWQMDTVLLIEDFISKGFCSITCCTMEAYLSKDWLGRLIDENFVEDLPATVDACGENGEYHSFCFDGPIFSQPVLFTKGQDTQRTIEQVILDKDQIPTTSTTIFWYRDFVLLHEQARAEQKTCARCGCSFCCNMADIENCQCYELTINKSLAAGPGNAYEDCLCANCLQKLSS